MFSKLSWVVIVLCTIVGGISAALLLSDGPQPFESLRIAVAVAITLTLPLLIMQARRDMHEVSVYLIIFGSIAAVITGSMINGSEELNYIVVCVAVCSTASALYALIYLIWEKFATDDVPNVLLEMFDKEDIYEAEGVQVVLTHTGSNVTAGNFFEAKLYLQNCFDNDLTVCVSLDNSRKNRKRMTYPVNSEFILPGYAVVCGVIPIKVNVDAKKKFSITAGIRVKGSGNKRIRRWRAEPHTPPASSGLRAFAVLGGVFISGGGLRIDGVIKPAVTTRESDEVREIDSEYIWELEDSLGELESTSEVDGNYVAE